MNRGCNRTPFRAMRGALAVSVILCSCVSLSCGSAEEDTQNVGIARQAIVNGKIETGFGSVGFLMSGGNICTATLVGHKTVLTAAHCVKVGVTPQVFFGGVEYHVIKVIIHPDYEGVCESEHCANDISVLRLSQEPAVSPSSVSSVAPSLLQEITLVGFGATSPSSADYEKRSVTTNVALSNDSAIGFVNLFGDSGMICYGDSGGPSFAVMGGVTVQVGVHSHLDLEFGPLALDACDTSAWDERVDKHVSWLRNVAEDDVFVDGDASTAQPTETTDTTTETEWSVPTTATTTETWNGELEASIVSPPSGTVIAQGVQITIEGSARSEAGITKAELYIDDVLLESWTEAPYTVLTDLPLGGAAIEFRVQDANGAEAVATSSVTVTASSGDSGTTGSGSATGDSADDGAFFDCSVAAANKTQPPLVVLLFCLMCWGAWARRRRAKVQV